MSDTDGFDIKKVHLNEKNPRTINKDKFQKLCSSIKDFPKMLELRPIVVDGDGLILGGNMRFRVLQELGLTLQKSWFKVADQLTEDEKKRFIIEDNVAFGDWDWEMLANEWNTETLKDWGLDIKNEEDGFYARNVKAPVYEPVNRKPDASELVEKSRVDKLIEEIDKSDISEKDKEFLKIAATRHYVFSYSKIADYYASSDKKVQDLMEKSALVIIDFEKAIEYGYVSLIKDIMEIQKEDYGE